VSPATRAPKRYDQAYFDRWYRDARTRVIRPGDVARQAHLAISAAEYLLGRPVRTALDVGAGEGSWRQALRAVRPRLRYTGVDPSEYAVRRFGRRRGIQLGTFDTLDELGLEGSFDLVVSVGVINYLTTRELTRGLESIAAMCSGVAFLEIWTTADDIVGDRTAWQHHPPSYYQRLLRRAGLVPCGLHCYAAPAVADKVAAMERL
jgi:cyclopropane fatty-acyl-phospholipid synthase-like methyltransferase